MARQFSPLVGFNLEAIWHTSVVCHGREWFFGSMGVETCAPKTTMLGEPMRIQAMGATTLTLDQFTEYINNLGRTSFQGIAYSSPS